MEDILVEGKEGCRRAAAGLLEVHVKADGGLRAEVAVEVVEVAKAQYLF